MPSHIGMPDQPLRVAIIGSGPAGFYAADALLMQNDLAVEIDIFDKLPAPYGLVRYGVAPDHQKIKSVTKLFARILAQPKVRFFGNVHIGTALTRADLRSHYDQVLYATGAQTDKRLNIPGENLAGSLSATEFVAWYNGQLLSIPADLVLRSIGYRGLPLSSVPFDDKSGTIPNKKGHVQSSDSGILPWEYVAGWAKRGPYGVIGTNKQDAAETVKQMVAKFSTLEPLPNRDAAAIEQLLTERHVNFITYADWQQIDEHERAMGQQQGRVRIKMTSMEQILRFLGEI